LRVTAPWAGVKARCFLYFRQIPYGGMEMTVAAAMDYPTLVSMAEPKVVHTEELNEKFINLL